ncbi:MAG: sigma-70 family RNA polymerase sigma factor [Candidatus Eisenbacteria bacterium]|uniref:Sigma-70 family RNA polymerase sigma factor n=1 Tax=Eiseniibacteriota bacterium TaxID=2212470 RepID=A0A956RQ11_UNCEI|nr:sigma-70 family RNA polymerase sigma factor [Candidatus Eisenbacteria bacterium]
MANEMSDEKSNDKDLVRRLGSGDSHAWEALLEERGPLILAVGRRLGLDPEERRDLFQNVFLKVFRTLHQLEDPGRLTSWLYTIAYHEGLRQRANTGRSRAREAALQHRGEPNPSLSEVELKERLALAADLRTAIDRLDTRCAKLLLALYLEDPTPSYQQIAETLGAPIGSVGPTRARCLEKLKRLLDSVSGPGEDESTDSDGEKAGK